MDRTPRYRLFCIVLGLVTVSCVAEVGPLTSKLGRLQVEQVLDMGAVQVGQPQVRTLSIHNSGPGALRITGAQLGPGAEAASHRFEVADVELWLRPDESTELEVRLLALQDSGGPVQATLTIISDTEDPDNPGTKQSAQVELQGRTHRYGLAVTPQPIAFGLVSAGQRARIDVTLTNVLDSPLTVSSPDSLDGRAALHSSAGSGRLSIDAFVGPQGDLPRGRAVLEPGASMQVPALFYAPSVSLGGPATGQWRVAGCGDPACLQTVELHAETDNNALICRPEQIDFGSVFPGLERQQELRCYNRSAVPLTIVRAAIETGGDPELSLGAPDLALIPPGGVVRMPAYFRPTEQTFNEGGPSSATVVVQVVDLMSGLEGQAQVELVGQVGGARLEIRPNPLEFGEVAINTELTQRLTIENVGFEPAIVQMVEVDTSATGLYSASTTSFTVPQGATIEFPVTFSPLAAGTFTSGLRFTSNDAVTPTHAVGLVGIGLDIPPCIYELEPAEVQFGAVRIGQEQRVQVRVRNQGPGDCLARSFLIELPNGQTQSAFSLADGPAPPQRLTPGQSFVVPLRFAPVTAGNHQAWLTFYISDPQASNPRIPLYGVGRPLIEVTCPGPITTPAGQPVSLTVQADAVGNIINYEWAIVQAPTGGIGTPNQWNPAPPSSATEDFLAFIVGVYELQATVTDDQGNEAACITEVTAEGRGLRVTLTWNGPGDVDLHVHRGTTAPWFVMDDCYYANRSPVWDTSFPSSQGPNPELDFDNTNANGPENTRINDVQLGETYTIAAHNFAQAQGRRATIQIYCGSGTIADATFTSRPLAGTESSNCSANDFWKVATVVFDSAATCRVVPIDTYVPSRDACSAY